MSEGKERLSLAVFVGLGLVVLGLGLMLTWGYGTERQAQAGTIQSLTITKTDSETLAPIESSGACFSVSDETNTVKHFDVCDDHFQGDPGFSIVCLSDLCWDTVSGFGTVDVVVAAGVYSVEETKPPAGFAPKPGKQVCEVIAGVGCSVEFVNNPLSVGGVAELPDVASTPLEASEASGTGSVLLIGAIVGVPPPRQAACPRRPGGGASAKLAYDLEFAN